MDMRSNRIPRIVLFLSLIALAVPSCAPRGDIERNGTGGGDEDALVQGDAPRANGGGGALDRMNQDKNSADALMADGRYRDAAALLAPWAARKAGDPQVYAMLARAQWKLGSHDEAVKNYEESLRLDYTSAYTHLELAEMLLDIGKSGRALTEFDLAVQFGKGDPLPHYNYGLALYDLGRVDDAVENWQKAYAYDPKDPRYAEAMGIGLSGKDPARALVYFEEAKTQGADHPGFHNNFGLLLEKTGDYERAQSEFLMAVSGDPANRAYRQNLALSYMKSQRPELAVPLWRELLDGEPDDPACRIYLGRAYLETGKFGDAVELLDGWAGAAAAGDSGGAPGVAAGDGKQPAAHLAGNGPGLDEAYAVLAMSFRGMKQPERASAWMKKAVELRPDSVAHRINYGVILAEDGKIADARAQWVEALRLDPENAAAKKNLSAYER
ncbi:MAG: Tetratricopeptide 2 repeat protein [Candidatus Krumholzibacteriota bacterium]|nr:Tetratricopeptide 2 repeat protein [Candidatus Krumholzibacteriota bacterium]